MANTDNMYNAIIKPFEAAFIFHHNIVFIPADVVLRGLYRI